MTKAFLATAVAAACAGLVACGGESDKDQVKEVATQLANADAKICDNATERLLKSLGGRAECKRAAKRGPATKKAKVGKVEVDGDKATAELNVGGEKGTVGLIKDGDDWKLDSVR